MLETSVSFGTGGQTPNDLFQILKFTIIRWTRLTTFLEAFHGCYRDGTNSTKKSFEFDYCWFAGLYLILRIALFGVYAFTRDWFELYSFLQFFCVVGLLAFIILRPYKDDYYNKLDAAMFALLLGINTLTMYNYGTTIVSSESSVDAFSLQYILVFVPLIYISVVLIRHLYHRCNCNQCPKVKRHNVTTITDQEKEGLVDNVEEPLTQSGSHDYLSFMNETGRLEDVNTYKPAKVWPNSRETYGAGASRDGYEEIEEQVSQHQTDAQSDISGGSTFGRGGEGD